MIIAIFIVAKLVLESNRKVDMTLGDNWNEIIDALMYDYENDDIASPKKIAALCFFYDSEIQNGGHIQYFTNDEGLNYKETLVALEIIGAKKQQRILEKVIELYKTLKLKDIKSEKEYIEEVLVGYDYEFENDKKEEMFGDMIEKCDMEYYNCTPEIAELIDRYANKHKKEFDLE